MLASFNTESYNKMILLKNHSQKNDPVNTYYINLFGAMTRQQKLILGIAWFWVQLTINLTSGNQGGS